MKQSLRPSHTYVRQVIGEEALRYGVHAEAVINIVRGSHRAVASAMRRIIAETNCTKAALADIWGCEASTVTAMLREPEPPRPPLHQARAVDEAIERFHDRLQWAHGSARAAQIIAGRDPATNRDIASWKRLGARGEHSEGRGSV